MGEEKPKTNIMTDMWKKKTVTGSTVREFSPFLARIWRGEEEVVRPLASNPVTHPGYSSQMNTYAKWRETPKYTPKK